MTEERFPNLADELAVRVREWVARAAPRVLARCDFARLTISLTGPGGDDDGTLVLEARFEEEYTTEETAGRVEGVKFG